MATPETAPEPVDLALTSSPSLSRRQLLAAGCAVAGLTVVARARPAVASPTEGSQASGPLAGAPEMNVLDHGAVGDGVTDDAPAFQAAMAELAEHGGGTLRIPKRTYLINDAITLTDNVRISADSATLIKTEGRYAHFVSLSGAETGYGSGVRNVIAEGLNFKGSFDGSLKMVCGFALHHAQDVTVRDCTFIEVQGTGHCLDLCGSERITVESCDFAGFNQWRTPGYNRAEAIQLDQSRWGAHSYPDDTAGFDGLFTRKVLVQDCTFRPITVDGVEYPGPNPLGAHSTRENHHYSDVTFRDNLAIGPHEDPSSPELDEANGPSSFKGMTHFPTVRNLTIADNTFVQPSPGSVRAISIFSIDTSDLESVPPSQRPVRGPVEPIASMNLTITGNEFRGFRPSADALEQEVIWIRGVPGGEASGITITDNTLSDCRADDGRGAFAVGLWHVADVTIRDNTIEDAAGGALLRTATEFAVADNQISAGPGSQPQVAIAITGGSDHGAVADNRTDGYAVAVSTAGAGDDIIIRENT